MKKFFVPSFIVLILLLFSPPVTSAEPPAGQASEKAKSYKDIKYKAVFNDEYPETLIDMINNSEKTIMACHFNYVSRGATGKRIMEALIAASKRGVGITFFFEGDKKGVGEANKKTAKIFEENGIKAVMDSEEKITHAKMVVVDSKYVLAGSTNLTDNSMRNNNESNLFIASPLVAKTLETYVNDLISSDTGDVSLDSGFGSEEVKVITDRNFFENALEMIKTAKSEIRVATYLFSYPESHPEYNVSRLFQGLIDARKRGVKVKVILERSSKDFNKHIFEINRKTVKILNENGVTDILYDDPERISHAKLLIKDTGEVLAGSTNWYGAEIDSAHQVNFVIRNGELTGQFEEYFDALYNKGTK